MDLTVKMEFSGPARLRLCYQRWIKDERLILDGTGDRGGNTK